MYIMSRSLIIEEKMNRLSDGYSAYAETDEIIRRMKREITKKQLHVICDQTDSGCWFIPEDQSSTIH